MMQFPAIPTSVLVNAAACFLVGSAGSAFGQECPLEITAPAPLNSNAASDNGGDARLQFTTDAMGNWGAVWQVVEIDDGTGEAHSAILFARSTDNGVNWTETSLISSATPTGVHVNFTPRIVAHGDVWIASWSSKDDLGGTIGDDRDILFARSDDGGASWAEPQPLNANAAFDSGDDSSVRIITEGEANWVAVWRSTDDLGGTIGDDWDLLYARSTDGGLSWTAPQPLSSNAGGDPALDFTFTLLTDGQGNLVAAWISEDDLGGTIGQDRDILFTRSTDGGANWSDVQPLNSNAAVDIRSDSSVWLDTDGMGAWVAAWSSADDVGGTVGEDWDILFARSTDGGMSWTEVEPLNSNATFDSGNDTGVKLATDGVGTWIAIWVSSDDLGGTIGNDSDILFARSTDAGASWTDPVPLNTNAATDSGVDRAGKLERDLAGNWLALWRSNDDLGGTIGEDWDILYAHSTDGGLNWTDPAPLNTNAATDTGTDGLLRIATDGASNWVATWLSDDDLGGTIGTDRDVLFARFQLGGNQDITICHVPPGNPNNAHTISVSENAVPAHLAHGDSCGPCEEDDGAPPDEDGNGETEASACPADVDRDGHVEAFDLAILLGNWGPCGDPDDCPADLDGDGAVGSFDLALLLGNWGPCE